MIKGFTKRSLSLFIVLLMIISTMSVMGGTVVSASEVEKAEVSAETVVTESASDETITEPGGAQTYAEDETSQEITESLAVDYTLELPYSIANGLYAYAGVQVQGTNAWQRWDNVNSKRYFYLPGSASDTEVIVLNTYSLDVVLNSVTIPAGEYRAVPYVAGATYTCSGATTQSVMICKSDAEGTIFINSAVGMTIKPDGGVKTTINDASYDLYDFLTSGTKNQEAGKVAGAVASAANGVDEEETTIKKIKGRGNTTWDLAKKPFNITFDENVTIDDMKGKKWSLLANAQDASLMRNRMVYDISNEVGMFYACDSRFVDMFVNGDYKGSYQLTQKIELGKNTVMPDLTEPEVEDVVDEDTGETIPYPKDSFDFVLEVDMASKAASSGDMTFNSARGQVMTHKIPDEPASEQIAFMKAKYQAFEDALYSDDMETLEKLIDINDLARAYLINEITKNLDAALTSCYFVYSSEKDMFYASPVWDFDNAIGNTLGIDDRRDINGKVLDTKTPDGWYARELLHIDSSYDPNGDGRTIFSQACYMTEKTSEGKTFMELAKEIWDAEFADILDILNGKAVASKGRLKSAEEYMSILADSGKWNYTAWALPSNANNSWVADHSKLTVYTYDKENDKLTSAQKTYSQNTFAGQQEFAVDWLVSRMNWLAAQFDNMGKDPAEGYVTVYFVKDSAWQNVYLYGFYGVEGGTAEAVWPGEYPGGKMTYVETDAKGNKIYSMSVPADIDYIKFSDGSSDNRRTDNVSNAMISKGAAFCIGNSVGTNKWSVKSYDYQPPQDSDEPEPTVPSGTTKTVYFSNNQFWAEPIYVYAYNEGQDGDPAFPGVEMTYYDTNEYGEDIYSAVVSEDMDFFIFSGDGGQTTDIPGSAISDGWCAYTSDVEPYYGVYELVASEEPTTQAPATEPQVTEGESTDAPETQPVSQSHFVIRSDFTDWKSNDAIDFVQGSSTVIEAVYTLKAGEYEFKIYDMSTQMWYSNDGVIIDSCSNWGFRTSNVNCVLNATGGVYKFTINVADTSRLGVTIKKIGDIDEKTGVYINGEFLETQVGKTVTYTVNLEAQELFENIQAYVSYDETKLTLVRKNQHPILTEREIATPGLDGVFYPDVDGIVTFNASKVQGYDFTQGNILVSLDFVVEAEGESTIELVIQEMAIKGEDGRSYFKGGKAVITDGIEIAQQAIVSDSVSDPVEDANSGLHYVVTADGEVQITYYTGSATELVIPSEIDGYKVTGIADYAFYDCTVLTSVVIPQTVTSVGAYAFYCCDALESITIPKSVTEIGKKAFAGASSLADVYYGSTELDWQEVAVAQENECLTTATIHYTEDVTATDDEVPTEPTEPTEPSEPAEPSEPTEPEAKYYVVIFLDYDGKFIEYQMVNEGESAVSPEAPTRKGYTFVGWDTEIENVTANLTVKALYEKIPTTPVPAPTTGTLKIDIAGSNGFTISIDGGTARPQGVSYTNTKAPIGASVTVTANEAADATFVGWVNPANGVILTTDYAYTFYASGNDSIKAVFNVAVEGVQMVTFKNDKAKRILDAQYYASTDSIQFPDDPTQVGYDFAGWSMTEAEIKNAIAAGNDVTVVANWTKQLVYINVTVTNGTGGGRVLANNALTVTANTAPAGQKFAYWTDAEGNIKSYNASYKFYPTADMEIIAVFVAEDATVEQEILVSVDTIDTTSIADKNVFYFSWYVPTEYTYVKAGILAVNKDNYNEATFVAGTSDGNVYDRAPSATTKPSGTTSWSKSNVTSGQTWVAKAYVQYKDANGQTITVYSDIVEATKE